MSFETITRAGGGYEPECTVELDAEEIRNTILRERRLLSMDTSDLEDQTPVTFGEIEANRTQQIPDDPLLHGDVGSTLEFEPLDPHLTAMNGSIAGVNAPQTSEVTAPVPTVEQRPEPLLKDTRPVSGEPYATPVATTQLLETGLLNTQEVPPVFSAGVSNHPKKERKPLGEYFGFLQAIPGLIDQIPLGALSEKMREMSPATRRKAIQGVLGALAFTGIMFGAVNALESDTPKQSSTAEQPEKPQSVKPTPSESDGTSHSDSGTGGVGSYEPPVVTTDRQDQDAPVQDKPQSPAQPQENDTPQNPDAGSTPDSPSYTPEEPNGGTGSTPTSPGSTPTPTEPGTGEPSGPSTEPTKPGGNGGTSGTPTQSTDPGGGHTNSPTVGPQEPGGEPSNPSGPGGKPTSSPRPTITQTAPQTTPSAEAPTQEPSQPRPTNTATAKPSFSLPAATSPPPTPEAPTQAPQGPSQPPAEAPTSQPTAENPQSGATAPAA